VTLTLRCLFAFCVLTALVPTVAQARIERFALIAGNDRGRDSDVPLRYAGGDAQKVYDVLRDLGGFDPLNMVLLHNESAETFRRTLITLNDRIRASVNDPNVKVVLFVYYSGHADEESLHLGTSDLALEELSQLVRGSAATFRLLVLDACRSGTLTRVKGGHIKSPFAVQLESSDLRGSGLAFITASAASEDAQESDELSGSLFTHAFVSGLAGAADRNNDGAVVLEEAYGYAYSTTLRLTGRTRAGLQHPTFQYDYRGQGELILTRLQSIQGRRGRLSFPAQIGFLIMREHESGPVLAEIGPHDLSRTLSLPPGRYFVLGRAEDHALESSIELRADQTRALTDDGFTRVEYARLVRKGRHAQRAAHALELGGRGHSALPNTGGVCWGAFVGYEIDLPGVSLLTRLGACGSSFGNSAISQATTRQYDLELRILHAWDLPLVSLAVGAGAAGVLFTQQFDSAGNAPSRTTPALAFHVAFSASLELHAGLYLGAELQTQAYLVPLKAAGDAHSSMKGAFAAGASLAAGKRF
jgi:Caspase domain